MLSDHDVINLLHYLREMNVLNDEEKKTVEGKTNREDKARCLIDTVLEKGERASSLMVDYLTKRQPELRIGELLFKCIFSLFSKELFTFIKLSSRLSKTI